MKTTFFVRLFYPHIGGVEKHVLKISEHFVSQGHEITIITEQYAADQKLYEEYKKIKIYRIPIINSSEKDKKWLIWKWVQKNQNIFSDSDILHVHDVMYWLYFWKLMHPLKKIYATFHGWEGVYPIPKKNIWQKRFDAFLAKRNICIGDFIPKWYKISTNEISYGAVEELSISKSKNIYDLLFLGRLDKDTGLEECIDLWKKMSKAKKIKFAVLGDGVKKTALPKEVIYLGIVNNPQEIIAKSKVVFCTGYLGILDAFIQKKPIIWSYNNPVKKDYLNMHPMAKHTRDPKTTYNWAKQQTWLNLGQLYEKIWKKSQ